MVAVASWTTRVEAAMGSLVGVALAAAVAGATAAPRAAVNRVARATMPRAKVGATVTAVTLMETVCAWKRRS